MVVKESIDFDEAVEFVNQIRKVAKAMGLEMRVSSISKYDTLNHTTINVEAWTEEEKF